MEQEFKHVGVAYERSDGVKKVTGAAEYVDDLRMGRMLYADVVRSPYAHAKVLSVDLSEAKKLPGVKVVNRRRCGGDARDCAPGVRTDQGRV